MVTCIIWWHWFIFDIAFVLFNFCVHLFIACLHLPSDGWSGRERETLSFLFFAGENPGLKKKVFGTELILIKYFLWINEWMNEWYGTVAVISSPTFRALRQPKSQSKRVIAHRCWVVKNYLPLSLALLISGSQSRSPGSHFSASDSWCLEGFGGWHGQQPAEPLQMASEFQTQW